MPRERSPVVEMNGSTRVSTPPTLTVRWVRLTSTLPPLPPESPVPPRATPDERADRGRRTAVAAAAADALHEQAVRIVAGRRQVAGEVGGDQAAVASRRAARRRWSAARAPVEPPSPPPPPIDWPCIAAGHIAERGNRAGVADGDAAAGAGHAARAADREQAAAVAARTAAAADRLGENPVREVSGRKDARNDLAGMNSGRRWSP